MSEFAEDNLLPHTWAFSTIGEIAEKIHYGYTASSENEIVGPKMLRITDIQNGRVEWDNVPYCSIPDSDKAKYLLQPGDIVFARTGATVGKSFLLQGHIPESVFASYLIRIILDNAVDRKYVYNFFQSNAYWRQISDNKVGIGQPNVNGNVLAKIQIPIPPLPEQRRIVAKLEELFTRLDAGVAALKVVQAQLKRYRASVLKAAVEGRLVPTEADLARAEGRTYEPADILLARILHERRAQSGKKYKDPTKPDTANLPELPEGWVWATVEQLAANAPNSITDGPFGSNLKTEHYTDSGPRVIRLQNIGDGVFVDERAYISSEHFSRLERHRVEFGDIVIAAFGARPPRACIIPQALGTAIVKADCIRFLPDPSIAVNRYLNYALNAEPTRARTVGSVHGIGRPRLNLGEIKAISLPIPPIVEQHRIVAEVERRLSVVEELEADIAANLKRADRLRQSILKRAFTGKLVPQDPNDEPASVLLERILSPLTLCIPALLTRPGHPA